MKKITSNKLRSVHFHYALMALLFYYLTLFCSYGQTNTREKPIKEMEDTAIIVHESTLLDLLENRDCPPPIRNHTNVNCYLNWNNEKNAVVKILDDAGRVFSGALLNTTAGENDNRHYILTANHCLHNSMGPFPDISQWQFCWHYESPECNSSLVPPTIYTKGAKVVARSSYTDFALLELYEDPAEAWDVTPYYLGWDWSFNAVNTVCQITMIHHPNGLVKKIHTNTNLIYDRINNFNVFCNGTYHYLENYNLWKTYWLTDKIPESGSSGAPLLNKDKRIIGQHNGWSCDYYQVNAYAYYIIFGKFSLAWEGYHGGYYNCVSDSTSRLKDWLDPLNTGQMTLDSRSACQKTIRLWHSLPQPAYHAVDSIISKQNIASDVTVSYKAGSEIVLQEGFYIESGSNFSAQIETLDCNGKQSNSYSPPIDENINDLIGEITHTPLSQPQNSHEINLLPNPNIGTFQLETNFPLTDIANFRITNLLGVSVYESNTLSLNTIELQSAPSGIYFIVMMLKDGTVLTQKMMIQR